MKLGYGALVLSSLSLPLPPSITGLSPGSGAVGTTVVLSGTNFVGPQGL